MNNVMIQIAVTVLVAMLLLAVEHYWPWTGVFQRRLHPTANYVLGTLALNVPLTVLFIVWGEWAVVIALWLVVVCGGATVIGSYWVDGWIAMRERTQIAEREARVLRPGGENGAPDER